MRNFISRSFPVLVLLIIGCQSVGNAQAPDAVKATFENKYPGENDPDWHLDRNGNYESNFKKKGKHYKADFTPEGKWIETERRIKKKELPKAIRKILKSEYDDFKIVEIEEVDHNSKGRFYDVELKKDGEKQDVEFNEAGFVIN